MLPFPHHRLPVRTPTAESTFWVWSGSRGRGAEMQLHLGRCAVGTVTGAPQGTADTEPAGPTASSPELPG